ncbi:MAG: serine/threonine-protein phosphatase [Mycoplasma sp.]|nr:serine/threonine-protein phosphatase [Mycoplasma sp.]
MKNWVVKTDVGLVRETNQDYAKVFENKDVTFAILCDGMGGHSGGEIASKVTIDQFEKEFKKTIFSPKMNFIDFFKSGLKSTKRAMMKKAQKNKILLDMGTTLTAALIFKEKAIVFNIGDSRTYYFNGNLNQITTDQNLRNYYIREQNLSETEASKVWGASALTSALGPKKHTSVEWFEVKFNSLAKYMILTSDGIHDFILKSRFTTIISNNKNTIEEKATNLLAEAMAGDSSDNLTTIIVEVNKNAN